MSRERKLTSRFGCRLLLPAFSCARGLRRRVHSTRLPIISAASRHPYPKSWRNGEILLLGNTALPVRRSVVYVSFGTVFSMGKRQEEETRRGLEATGRPYLWVGRKGGDGEGGAEHVNGVVVEWCDQMKVLSHPAVGCFVTHCGWNSTLESVTRGVPMVAVPQWTDQPTVAWLVEARMGVGVRARVDGEGVVERGELQRCVDAVMGDGEALAASGIRAWADRWMGRANEAIAGGGTSERNLRAFATEL